MKDGLTVVGLDEVGRGCLAGPVSACAFAFRGEVVVEGLRDSKKLTDKRRRRLVPTLMSAGWFGFGDASAQEIDALGIVNANFLAMSRALDALESVFDLGRLSWRVVVDGNAKPPWDGLGDLECLVGADDLVAEVSAASVLAKVRRDDWMAEQSLVHKGYGFELHAGYLTSLHAAALKEQGPCDLHRMTFAPLNRRR